MTNSTTGFQPRLLTYWAWKKKKKKKEYTHAHRIGNTRFLQGIYKPNWWQVAQGYPGHQHQSQEFTYDFY